MHFPEEDMALFNLCPSFTVVGVECTIGATRQFALFETLQCALDKKILRT